MIVFRDAKTVNVRPQTVVGIGIDGVNCDEVFQFNKQISTKYSTNNLLEVSQNCQLLFVVGQMTISSKIFKFFYY